MTRSGNFLFVKYVRKEHQLPTHNTDPKHSPLEISQNELNKNKTYNTPFRIAIAKHRQVIINPVFRVKILLYV